MPGQIVLNPEDTTTTGHWTPPGPIPLALRQFGRFPDVGKWLPGDLLLFSATNPSWTSRSIIGGQERGGYAPEDARWHHTAVYLGDGISICEAAVTGVRHMQIYPYIGNYLLRVRRDPTLEADARWKIAMQSLTRLRSAYGFRSILWLALRSMRGYWQPGGGLPPLGARAVICSQLFSDSYSLVTGWLLVQRPSGTVKPADLSMTRVLTDVETTWLSTGPILDPQFAQKLLERVTVQRVSFDRSADSKIVYKSKLRVVLRNDTGYDLEARDLTWKVEASDVPAQKPLGWFLQLEDGEGGWGQGKWQKEVVNVHVPSGRVFRVWIGLDQSFSDDELRRRHETKRVGILVLPVRIAGYDVTLERRV